MGGVTPEPGLLSRGDLNTAMGHGQPGSRNRVPSIVDIAEVDPQTAQRLARGFQDRDPVEAGRGANAVLTRGATAKMSVQRTQFAPFLALWPAANKYLRLATRKRESLGSPAALGF